MRVKGIVLEKEGRWCILLASDGQFHRVPLPPGPVEVGQEITAEKGLNRILQTVLVAASLLVAVVAWQLWGTMVPRAVAYVSLDLNPSIELELDRKAIIISASGLNKQGNELMSVCPVQNLSLEDGIDKLIRHTAAAGYFEREMNIVLSTVTVTGNTQDITEERLVRSIEGSLSKSRVQAEVLVQDVQKDIREEAKSLGLSPGRYLVLKDCESQGVKVSAEYLNEQPIANLERDKGIKINVNKLAKKQPGQRATQMSPGREMADKDKEKKKQNDHVTRLPPGQERAGNGRVNKDKEANKQPGQGIQLPPGQERAGNGWVNKDKEANKQPGQGVQLPPGQERAGNSPAIKDKEANKQPRQGVQLPPGQEKKKGEDGKAKKPALPDSEILGWEFGERTNPWQAIKNKARADKQTEKRATQKAAGQK